MSYDKLRQYLLQIGFVNSQSITFLFIFNANGFVLYLLMYIDDTIIIGSDIELLDKFVSQLAQRFCFNDLGSLSYFLGVEVLYSPQVSFFHSRNM